MAFVNIEGDVKYSLEELYNPNNYCIIQGDKVRFYKVKDFVKEVVKYYFRWHEKRYGEFVDINYVGELIDDLCILNVEKISIGELDTLGPKTCEYLLNLLVPDVLNDMVKKAF